VIEAHFVIITLIKSHGGLRTVVSMEFAVEFLWNGTTVWVSTKPRSK